MFRVFDQALRAASLDLLAMHPSELILLLEYAWSQRIRTQLPNMPPAKSTVEAMPLQSLGLSTTGLSAGARILVGAINSAASLLVVQRRGLGLIWDHLIYAYMIENTKVFDIFRKVVFELTHGERLSTPLVQTSLDTQRWLRLTEELFFRDPAPFSILSTSSHLRPDFRATRRNAYQRMFGMDLTHGAEDGRPYPYVKAEAANNNFVSTFEEFLREVWVGMANASNTSGPKPTDDATIASLAKKLQEMLASRRSNNNLAREEFVAVTALSWFHLAVETDTPIVVSLRAETQGSAEQRLFKIAERVGLSAHGLANSYFEISRPISNILTAIETAAYNSASNASLLYTPGTSYTPPLSGGPESDLRTIIAHWTNITGRDIKAQKVAVGR